MHTLIIKFIAIDSMFLLLYWDNIVITRKPSGTTTCAKHLIHNINALQREHGTLNYPEKLCSYNIHTLIITLIAIDSMFLLLYWDNIVITRKPLNRHYDMCKAFNPQILMHYNVNTAP